MTQINFPTATADGQTYDAPNGVVYTYVGTPPNGYWSGTFQNEGFATLDGRYLKLDSTNDPVIGGLNITNATVGIGTTSPVANAHLDITGAEGKILVRTDESDECIDSVNLENSAFSPLRIRGSDVSIQNGSTINLFVKADGNVGIGTSSPSQLLDLESSSGARIAFTDTGTRRWSVGTPEGGSTAFSVYDESGASEAIRITSSGNVGIGTDIPSTKLTISETGAEAVIQLGRTDAATAGVLLVGSGSNANFITGGGTKDLFFSTNNTERMRIDSDGNVGINTTNPEMPLQIGDSTASGCVRLGKTRSFMLAGDSNSGAVYFGPTLTNPTAGIESSWDSTGNRPAVTIGVIRDGAGSAGGGAKPKSSWRYDNSIRHYINNEEIYRVFTSGINIPSGKGITFNVSGDTSGTVSSNSLDDYEEGTWTPTIVDATAYSTQIGNYVKIGRWVYVQFRVQPSAANLSTNAVEVRGLPFQSSSSGSAYGGAIQTYDSLIDQNGIVNYRLHYPANSNSIRPLSNGTSIATNNSNCKVVGNHIFSGWYLTTT